MSCLQGEYPTHAANPCSMNLEIPGPCRGPWTFCSFQAHVASLQSNARKPVACCACQFHAALPAANVTPKLQGRLYQTPSIFTEASFLSTFRVEHGHPGARNPLLPARNGSAVARVRLMKKSAQKCPLSQVDGTVPYFG